MRRLALLTLCLMACDPIGTLRVVVVADGPGPTRTALPQAKVTVLRPGFGPTIAESAGVPAQFKWSKIPGIGFDAEVQVDCEGYERRVFSIADVCVQPGDPSYCQSAFIYAGLKKREP